MFHVYIDYTMEDSPRPFYVGKGTEERVKLVRRNEAHSRISAKHGMKREIALITEDEDLAFDYEKHLITVHKTRSHGRDGHWGANLTDGGEGISGLVRSDETRRKISEAQKGRPISDEIRRRISAVMKGQRRTPLSDEHKRKLSEAQKGQRRTPLSDEHKRKLSEAKKGKALSEEHKRKISEGRIAASDNTMNGRMA